jgi:fatty acid desaturase
MEAESPDTTQGRGAPSPWKQWAQVAACAVVLLVISQALWIWQTWPVRELLQPPASAGTR